MASFKVEWKQSARKELRKLEKQIIPKILQAVEALSENPHPSNSRKLHGAEYTYRIRVGDYRIVYSVYADRVTLEIVRIGHRRDIYKKFG